MRLLATLLFLSACQQDLNSSSLPLNDSLSPIAEPGMPLEGVVTQNPEPRSSTLEPGLNELIEPLEDAWIEETCNPSQRYLSRYASCVGCDGVCVGVEWPPGARYGNYAFACVPASNATESSILSIKSGLCRRAGSLYSYCGFMSIEGWRQIYVDERHCELGPSL